MATQIPTVSKFDTTRIPVEGSSTFRADASYVWSTIPSVINTINDAGSAMNLLGADLETIQTNVTNIQTDVTTKQTDVTTKHDTVVAKEALVNPHYTAIDTVSANILAVQNVDSNMVVVQNAKQNALVAKSAANYKGDWVANYNTTGYALADSVTYIDGNNYVSKVDGNLVEPTTGTNTTKWNFIEAVSPTELALKANSANPVFTGSITEQVGTMTTAIDATLGTIQELTMTADTTLADSLLDGQSVTLILTNGGFTVTYPLTTWVGGAKPKLSATDIIVFFKASGVLYGSWNGATA